MPYILSFLSARDIARVAMVSQFYLQMAKTDPIYCETAAMCCDYTMEVDAGMVDAVVYRKGHLYTAVGQICKLWDLETGNAIHRQPPLIISA